MSSLAWLWLQDSLARHGVELEEIEAIEEALEPGPTGSPRREPEAAGRAALTQLQARIGNRAMAQLLAEFERRRSLSPRPGDRPAAAAGTEHPSGPRVENVPAEAPGMFPPLPGVTDVEAPERASALDATGQISTLAVASRVARAEPSAREKGDGEVEIGTLQEAPRKPGGDPARMLATHLDRVVGTIAGGFASSAWLDLLASWDQAPPAARDDALSVLRSAILRLRPTARAALADALERVGAVPGSDLLIRLRALLAAAVLSRAPEPPPPADDGG